MDVNSKDYIINAPVKLERNKRNLTALTWAHVNAVKLRLFLSSFTGALMI